MASRKSLVSFTLAAGMLSTAGGGIAARAQSYTAPAGIPAETAPGGLTGVFGSRLARTAPAPVAGWVMVPPENTASMRGVPRHRARAIGK